MLKVHCYEVKTVHANPDYFGGGYCHPAVFCYEYFATREEAEEDCAAKRKNEEHSMSWCEWWMERYFKNENFTITEIVKEFGKEWRND